MPLLPAKPPRKLVKRQSIFWLSQARSPGCNSSAEYRISFAPQPEYRSRYRTVSIQAEFPPRAESFPADLEQGVMPAGNWQGLAPCFRPLHRGEQGIRRSRISEDLS